MIYDPAARLPPRFSRPAFWAAALIKRPAESRIPTAAGGIKRRPVTNALYAGRARAAALNYFLTGRPAESEELIGAARLSRDFCDPGAGEGVGVV